MEHGTAVIIDALKYAADNGYITSNDYDAAMNTVTKQYANKIQKAPGAQSNTFAVIVDGTSVYPSTYKYQSVNVTVMFTSDEHGETLSLHDPTTKKQIVVPFESVDALIAHARNSYKYSAKERK